MMRTTTVNKGDPLPTNFMPQYRSVVSDMKNVRLVATVLYTIVPSVGLFLLFSMVSGICFESKYSLISASGGASPFYLLSWLYTFLFAAAIMLALFSFHRTMSGTRLAMFWMYLRFSEETVCRWQILKNFEPILSTISPLVACSLPHQRHACLLCLVQVATLLLAAKLTLK